MALSTDESTNRGAALGVVVYDLHLLAAALLLNEHSRRAATEAVPWRHCHRLAVEVMLLKSRALLELLSPSKRPRKDDITLSGLGLEVSDLPADLVPFRRYVDKRTAHLTMERADPNLKGWKEQSGESITESARRIFDLACEQLLDKAIATGVTLVHVRHLRYAAELAKQRQLLANQRLK